MFQLEYFDDGAGKWRPVGDERVDFSDPNAAWGKALETARTGGAFNGARYRVVSDEGDHTDDCPLGVGGGCDCREPAVVIDGRVRWRGFDDVWSELIVGSLDLADGTVRPAMVWP